MSSALDGVLKDLELACGGAGSSSSGTLKTNSHLAKISKKSVSTSEDSTYYKDQTEAGLKANLVFGDVDLRQKGPPPVPQRDLSSKIMATTISNNAVANNLNELDVLLQDLSNARLVSNLVCSR